ncbi:MAG TPA: HDOD domain-containing protein [Bryobacteraceae bacterium]|nr:HDOD domain-containing protein [Bryobacteraceae bacterium]
MTANTPAQDQAALLNADQDAAVEDQAYAESAILLARQPILDRNLQVWGYELLYRSSSANHCDANESNARATARVIVNSLLNIGIDNLVGSKLAFINVEREILLSELLGVLPRGRVVLEILETVAFDPEIAAACAAARNNGLMLALDDVDDKTYGNPLLGLVDIVKVDFQSASAVAIKQLASRHNSDSRPVLLAEKVETQEQFEEAISLGYQYFQGFFFARPALISGCSLPASTISLLRILGQLAIPDLSISRLEASVRQHLSLVHRLFRYVNSGAFARQSRIHSVQHALALLGMDQLRKLLSLMVVADINGKGPQELLVMALVRARMAEMFAPSFGLANRQASLFTMGLFSLLDVILRRPLEEILRELNLDEDLSAALLQQSPTDHPVRRLYDLVVACEIADWSAIVKGAEGANISLKDLSEGHLQAIRWADQVAAA